MMGGCDDRGYLPFPFNRLSEVPDIISIKTKTRMIEICKMKGIVVSDVALTRTIRKTVSDILQNQGVQMNTLGSQLIATDTCANRVFDKASSELIDVTNNWKEIETIHKNNLSTPEKEKELKIKNDSRKQRGIRNMQKFIKDNQNNILLPIRIKIMQLFGLIARVGLTSIHCIEQQWWVIAMVSN